MKVNLLILCRSPQSLDKDIVPPGAFTVHADTDVVLFLIRSGASGGDKSRMDLFGGLLRGKAAPGARVWLAFPPASGGREGAIFI